MGSHIATLKNESHMTIKDDLLVFSQHNNADGTENIA
jgi:hypothetical protein